jgi:hypothetical protein
MRVPAWLDLVGRPARAAERDAPAHRRPPLRTPHFHLCGTVSVRATIGRGPHPAAVAALRAARCASASSRQGATADGIGFWREAGEETIRLAEREVANHL